MKVLNILSCGGVGGIENLCKDYSVYSRHENYYIVIWYPGKFSEDMAEMGKPVLVLDTKPSRYIQDFLRLKNYITENAFEAVIVHQLAPLTSIYVLLIKKFFPDLKILTYVHSNANDWPTNGITGKLDLILKKHIYRNSVRTVCISENVKQSVIEFLGVDAAKLTVIYNGVDCSKFQEIEDKKQSEKDCLEIIYVGRLEKVKGVQNILHGLSLINIPYRLNIVGDGSYRDELQSISQTLGLESKVQFTGLRDDVPKLLGQSDIFIHMPDWQEGFGITVVEAMAAGCICIVNDRGALPEIVESGVNGFVLHDNSGKELAEVLNEIWTKREDMFTPGKSLYNIGNNAVSSAKKYSIEGFADKLDSEVENL